MIAPQTMKLGQTITLSGYADDYDKAIVAIHLSFDGGDTWTRMDVSDTTADLWVHWSCEFTPEAAGEYQVKVRSENEDGKLSPDAAVASLFVEA